MLTEDSYGRRKRLDFVAAAIKTHDPTRILDIGCGTGANLTVPLARIFCNCQFLGADVDVRSIESARNADLPANVRFVTIDALGEEEPFDLVIASEVLEHVEDPPAFLDRLRKLTRPEGRLILTVPNGYGPFEWCALFEALLHMSGLQRLLRSAKHRLIKTPAAHDAAPESTLAVSPHINFFSRRILLSLFQAAGFKVRRFQPTTFLCGYGIDSGIRSSPVIAWNAAVVDRLPPWCASDWMFELEPDNTRRQATWRPSPWGRFRRWLNRRRWGLQ
ncbi:MAG: methyltransferase domain-containing protein [Proteobacteria bacterium]|nr:methyltransferase domain-containing protein [Pseudomonadota bacterium]